MSTVSPLRFGFRRRCSWCGVVLRGWQLNSCRRCKKAILYSPSPPCGSASRWDDQPDVFKPSADSRHQEGQQP